MKRIYGWYSWTYTHYGRGACPDAEWALQSVRGAYRKVASRSAPDAEIVGVGDEDWAFVERSCPTTMNTDTWEGEPNDVHPLDSWDGSCQPPHYEPLRSEAEAVRDWWNKYYSCGPPDDGDEMEVIYCGGKGPDGIGGFVHPNTWN